MLAVGVVAALALAACGGDDDATSPATGGDVTVAPPAAGDAALPAAHDAWVRMPATGQTVAAGYVTFVNAGDADVRLVGVSSPLGTTELHETIADDDGVMRMQERPDGFVVPAGGEFVLAPGGAHVMFLGIDPLDMATMDEVELTFDFGDLGELRVMAEIRRDSAMPDHGDDMGHGDADGDGDADHDGDTDAEHGDGDDTNGDAAHGEDGHGDGPHGDAELDVAALHALDDELHAGTFEPERQRVVVAESLAGLDAMLADEPTEIPDDVDVDRLRTALGELDAALAAGDVDAAKALAFEVHDLTHSLLPGDHHSH